MSIRTRRSPTVGSHVSTGLLIITGTLLLFGAGCSGPAEQSKPAALQPVHAADGGDGTRQRSNRTTRSGTPTDEPSEGRIGAAPDTGTQGQHDTDPKSYGDPPGANNANSHPDDPADRALVGSLLERYDGLVTRLALEPSTSLEPGAPARLEWSQLVPGESALSNSVLDQLVHRPAMAGTRLLPGPDGVSFRHHVERTSRRDDGSIEFSWCGYSPGIRIEASTGKVLDDQVAHIRGIGRIDRSQLDPELWVLDAFDQLDLKILSPGSGDPCPGHNRATAGR
ncbi:MAG: hypothetical protein WBA45_06630 [Microthrixaceae bacterium]